MELVTESSTSMLGKWMHLRCKNGLR